MTENGVVPTLVELSSTKGEVKVRWIGALLLQQSLTYANVVS